MEQWKKVKDFDTYSISNKGNLRNDLTNKILKTTINTNGYETVTLVKDKKKYLKYIHRMMAIAFLSNPENKKQVDHINGNKIDNRLENLRWVTVSENCFAYGYEERILHRMKKIKATHKNGDVLYFNSRNETAKYFKCDKSQIDYGRYYKKGNKKDWIFELS